jgi:hypothetical protein
MPNVLCDFHEMEPIPPLNQENLQEPTRLHLNQN